MKQSVLKRLVLVAVAALSGAGVANAHNDFTDRAEYFAATPQPPVYYEPQFYYYPSYTQPLYTAHATDLSRAAASAPLRRWRLPFSPAPGANLAQIARVDRLRSSDQSLSRFD